MDKRKSTKVISTRQTYSLITFPLYSTRLRTRLRRRVRRARRRWTRAWLVTLRRMPSRSWSVPCVPSVTCPRNKVGAKLETRSHSLNISRILLVLAAYDSFYEKYPSGEITQEFLNHQKYPIFCFLILGSVRGAELSGNNLGVFVQEFNYWNFHVNNQKCQQCWNILSLRREESRRWIYFRVFDEDKSGELSFYEFLQVNLILRL